MSDKEKAKAEAEAFIEKLKSLTFGTGTKPPCPLCQEVGKALKLAGILRVRIERRRRAPEQESFAE